jgi:hypothetical protein
MKLILLIVCFGVLVVFVKAKNEHVILHVRDLNSQQKFEYCGVQKFRSPYEQVGLRWDGTLRRTKYLSLVDIQVDSPCIAGGYQRPPPSFVQGYDAIHFRLKNLGECEMGEVLEHVKSESTRMVIVGTDNENLVI